MIPQSEDDSKPLESTTRSGGLANVFRSLTSSKGSSKSPTWPLATSAAAAPKAESTYATSNSSRELSLNNMDTLQQLKQGTAAERLSAATALRQTVSEYPMSPVLDIWYAAKDLIGPNNQASLRTAGWELLTECAKHPYSTDLERKEFFQTLSAPSNPKDFHLQLSAMIQLTNHGRMITGFDYELVPLLNRWLQKAYPAARKARKGMPLARHQEASSRSTPMLCDEDENLVQLFSFLLDIVKFSFNNASESSIIGLIDSLLAICMDTNGKDDLKNCIGMLDAVVTFASIPQERLSDCIQVLSSIYAMIPDLEKSSWHTISNICKSHNGPAAVRILLDALRDRPADGATAVETTRKVRGALASLKKLLSKASEKGYPTVPYAPLVDGLSNALKTTSSLKAYVNLLQLINTLFDDGNGQIHPLVVGEDWSLCLDVAGDCLRRADADADEKKGTQGKDDSPDLSVEPELLALINRLDIVVRERSDFVPRESVIKFFTDVHSLLPDSTVGTVLDYFDEFRCCFPSDLQWEENLSLVLDAFFCNTSRSTQTRLRALKTVTDAYEIVDLVGDGSEHDLIARLSRGILRNVAEETDIATLEAIVSLMVSVVVLCNMDLFHYAITALEAVVSNDRLRPPVAISTLAVRDDPGPSLSCQSPSNVVAKGLVRMFLRVINSHGEKSVRLFNALVGIAKPSHCEMDARLTAMKMLFRLRADWANRIFATDDPESTFLATAMCRTDASFAKKQAEEAAQALRLSRGEHGLQSRPSRGMSVGQSSIPDRTAAARTSTGARGPQQKYRQIWSYPDQEALPEETPQLVSPVLLSCTCHKDCDEDSSMEAGAVPFALEMSLWLDTVLAVLQGSNWEVYSFVLVHLPSQLSNHAVFTGAIVQVKELRKLICEQLRTKSFQEPPNASGLRRADVAICLFHSLTMILSYHEHFTKSDEDEIVQTFVAGMATWERTAKYCIHALSICCHELPLSTSKCLIQVLNQMAAIITQPHVSVHVLEFLASLSRLHDVFVNFREDDFRIVFGICFRYLEYAREKKCSNRSSHASEASAPTTPSSNPMEASQAGTVDDVPQYVHALAYHVIMFWFLALKLQDRARHVGWIAKKLFPDDSSSQAADEQAITSIDFIQRVTYADVDESSEDPYFNEARFGAIIKKQWLVGYSIITIKQATVSGWAQIIKRQPSGTSAYTVRETYTPPPPHQTDTPVDVSREGQATSNAILPSHLLVQLMAPVPQYPGSVRPIPLPDEDATARAIRMFDLNSSLDGHKVGVIYIGEGQKTEAEILANVSGSSDYVKFLNNLGTLTRLKGATFNTQGLDYNLDLDGQYTFCWRDRVTEIVFHVTTQMPTNLERDAQCVQKKRHIGNDFVNIIFNDSGLPFDFDTFPSDFNSVYIVITPASRASFVASRYGQGQTQRQPFYRVQVMSKPGFPEVSPASETKMISLKALPGFVRLLALNASMFSVVWHRREVGEHISSWSARLREIKRLRERHAPKTTASAATTASPAGGAAQGQQLDASRPSGSVRDSLNSLRRTSVATFLTSTTEQTSQRSSTQSTVATSEAEQSHSNAVNWLVEFADFSKWA
ncbi:hypothetical protein CDD82_3264 [Ophiocordyceps australis]|uniref:Rap-GAP domain-containing protein n=1 Tax=Ophiocordyceps australis TaxID=1399860 RepID=A0A2C5ZAF6_9HYPO|nr:hypothetical protein CDD82_3264 [Ophiocordyceps australis]